MCIRDSFGTGAEGSTDDVADFVAFGLYVVAIGLVVMGIRSRGSTDDE